MGHPVAVPFSYFKGMSNLNWRRNRITIDTIQLLPIIIRARIILAIPDKSTKRKSEFRVIDPENKDLLATPGVEPRYFLDCEVVDNYWGNGPHSIVIDCETYEVYKNITGSTWAQDKPRNNQYLKHVPDSDFDPKEITNLQYLLGRLLGDPTSVA